MNACFYFLHLTQKRTKSNNIKETTSLLAPVKNKTTNELEEHSKRSILHEYAI